MGLSDNTCELYTLTDNQLCKLHSIECDANVVEVKTCQENNNMFYVGTSDCKIQLFDVRTPNSSVLQFYDTTIENGGKMKPLTCFDVSPNNVLLSGGTDEVELDAYILFWDVRNAKFLGGYWESHTDDVTQVWNV